MNLNGIVTKSELMAILAESAKNEFKPKFGNNAKRDDQKNENEKATNKIRKDVEDYDKDGRKDRPKRKESLNNDYNKGLLHPNFEIQPGNDWIERVKSQVHGYPSKYNEEHNDMDKSLDYEGNKNIYKSESDRVKRDAKNAQTERESGLKANHKDHRGWDYSNKIGVINESYLTGPIIQGYQAQEISDDCGYDTQEEGAAEWFRGVICNDTNFEEGKMPKYHQFIQHIDEIDADMYYDYGADYYFVVKKTENTLNEDELGCSISPENNGANRVQQFTHPDANPGEDGDIRMDDGIKGGNYNQRKTVSESKPMKRLKFKNTIFLSEAQVLERVPDEYKIDENRFYMRDKTGTDYLIECQADQFGYVHTQIVNKINKQVINEELEKMKRLAGYNYGDDNKKIDKSNIEDMSESIREFRQILSK